MLPILELLCEDNYKANIKSRLFIYWVNLFRLKIFSSFLQLFYEIIYLTQTFYQKKTWVLGLGLDLDQNTKTQKKTNTKPKPKNPKKTNNKAKPKTKNPKKTNTKPKETQTNLLIKPTNCIHFKNQLIEFYKMM